MSARIDGRPDRRDDCDGPSNAITVVFLLLVLLYFAVHGLVWLGTVIMP